MEEKKKEQKTESKKVKIDIGRKEKSEPQKVSFDAYFRMLMSKDISVRPHHKAPMKDFFNTFATEATVEEFDKILKKY